MAFEPPSAGPYKLKYALRSKGSLFDETPPDPTAPAQPSPDTTLTSSDTTQPGTTRTNPNTTRPCQSGKTRTNQTEPDKMADEEREAWDRLEREAREREQRDEGGHLTDDDMDVFMPRTLREFNVPRAGDVRGAIWLPRIPEQQPNFNSGVVNMVQQNTFHGLDHEDPRAHLQTFLECITTIKTNGKTADYTK